jgi:hypothetical protein
MECPRPKKETEKSKKKGSEQKEGECEEQTKSGKYYFKITSV